MTYFVGQNRPPKKTGTNSHFQAHSDEPHSPRILVSYFSQVAMMTISQCMQECLSSSVYIVVIQFKHLLLNNLLLLLIINRMMLA